MKAFRPNSDPGPLSAEADDEEEEEEGGVSLEAEPKPNERESPPSPSERPEVTAKAAVRRKSTFKERLFGAGKKSYKLRSKGRVREGERSSRVDVHFTSPHLHANLACARKIEG